LSAEEINAIEELNEAIEVMEKLRVKWKTLRIMNLTPPLGNAIIEIQKQAIAECSWVIDKMKKAIKTIKKQEINLKQTLNNLADDIDAQVTAHENSKIYMTKRDYADYSIGRPVRDPYCGPDLKPSYTIKEVIREFYKLTYREEKKVEKFEKRAEEAIKRKEPDLFIRKDERTKDWDDFFRQAAIQEYWSGEYKKEGDFAKQIRQLVLIETKLAILTNTTCREYANLLRDITKRIPTKTS